MKFLFLDAVYAEPISLLYERIPGLDRHSYSEQLAAIYDMGIDRTDALPRNLRLLGHEAEHVIMNVLPLQRKWAEERGLEVKFPPFPAHSHHALHAVNRISKILRRRLGLRARTEDRRWQAQVVKSQVEASDPDVIFNCNILQFSNEFLFEIKEGNRKLIGECGYPVPDNVSLRPYDLLVSCVPNLVDRFRRSGAKAELLRHAFDPTVLPHTEGVNKAKQIVFIGSLSEAHSNRVELLEAIARQVPLVCHGKLSARVSKLSPLRKLVRPAVWGYEMYRELKRSAIVLNTHVDMAGAFAGNMRLFEATGVGSFLLTDWKENMGQLFRLGSEAIAFRDPLECVQLARHYLEHDDERESIARAGQQRTLREHTHQHRMEELVQILNRHWRN